MKNISRVPLKLFYTLAGNIYHHDARIALNLYSCFPTYRSAFAEIMNQLHRIAGFDRAYDVQGIVIEPTNYCNLRCKHCTPQNLKAEKGYMKMGLFKKMIDENPQLTSIILTRNGEPFLHPEIFEMISYAAKRKIYVIVFTNGMLLDDAMIEKIFKSGLGELSFSLEGVGDFYEYNRGESYEKCAGLIRKVLEKHKALSSDMKIGINATFTEDPNNALSVKKEWGGIVDFVTLEPLMCQKYTPRNVPCRTLWRNLVISWNGDVVPCCTDMENKLSLGNANNDTLKSIFNGPVVRALRRGHLKKNYPCVCKYCDTHFG